MNRLLDAADRYEGRFKAAIKRSALDGQRKISIARTIRAFKLRDRASVEREALMGVLGFQKSLDTALPPAIMAVVSAGAAVAAVTLARDAKRISSQPTIARQQTVTVSFRFDRTNPSAVLWVERHAAELVTEVTDQTRRAIRKIITKAFVEGIPPREAAVLLRKVVGLHSRDEEALSNLKQRILENPGGKVYAGKRAIRVPEKGMTNKALRDTLSKYADRLHNRRALLIARTETIRGSNEGQAQLWNQAVDAGKLSRTAKRVWITTPDERLCPICEGLEGKIAPLNGSFDGRFSGPPAHPACRCTTGLT
jgi:SPP1 gp7 family putative phage head morphogenesis protein